MVDSVKYGPVELWWQAQTLKTQVDQDMKNGKPTAADYALLRQLVSNAQGLIATTTNDQVANNLNNFLSAIEGADPFANDVFDSATEKLGAESVFSGGYSLPSLTLPSDPGTMLIMLEDLEAQNAASSEKGSLANIQAGGQDQLIAAENSEAQDKKAQQAEQAAAAQTKVGNAEGIGSSIGGTIAAIFGLIAAILVTGLTLGGGVGLIAVASVGLTLAIFNDINTGLQQAGVQTTGVDGKSEPLDLSLGGLVKAIVQQQVKDGTIAVAPAKGKPGALVFKDQAALDSYTSGWTITANLLVTIAMCATGAGILKLCASAPELADDAANLATDVSEEAKGVIQTLKNVMKQPGMASKVVEGAGKVNDGVSAGLTIAQGVNQYDVATDNFQAAQATAAKEYFTQLAAWIKSNVNIDSKFVSSQLKALSELQQSASDTIKNIGDTERQVAEQNAPVV